MIINRVCLADSYKYSQPMQYPKNVTSMYDYMESRGGEYDSTVFFGLQYILKEFLETPITIYEVEEANRYAKLHGEPFDYKGWQYIVEKYKGKLPVRIKAVAEGSVIPTKHPLVTIESTDEKVFWVVGFLETLLMKVWYPTTVATKSYYVKKMLNEYAEKYSDSTDGVSFQYHNFGDRGSTTVEAAAVGGMAHLTQFLGTDNFKSLFFADKYYGVDEDTVAGYSIPATEHSTVTSWGRDGEFEFYENYIETFKGSPIVACVSDSYDIYKATRFITSGTMKQKIESDEYPIFVIRPDSGDPVEVVSQMLDICYENDVAYTENSKGLKVFNKYRIIYGDGISPVVIKEILDVVVDKGYAPDNLAFGSGGDLMQNVNRDTLKFAIKCSSVTVDGQLRDVFKDPITDKGKASKKGRVTTFYNSEENEYAVGDVDTIPVGYVDLLQTVYENGEIKRTYSFDRVRANTWIKYD